MLCSKLENGLAWSLVPSVSVCIGLVARPKKNKKRMPWLPTGRCFLFLVFVFSPFQKFKQKSHLLMLCFLFILLLLLKSFCHFNFRSLRARSLSDDDWDGSHMDFSEKYWICLERSHKGSGA